MFPVSKLPSVEDSLTFLIRIVFDDSLGHFNLVDAVIHPLRA